MRRSRLSKYFVLFFLSLFLISFFALNTFADDVDAVTRAAPQVSPNRDVTPSFWEIQARDAESVAARSDAILSAQRQVNLNLPNSPVIDMFGTGAGIFFGIISNIWVILLLVLVLLTTLFYAIYSLGLMNIPVFKGSTDAEKSRHMRMIAMTLAMLSSIGLLGFAGYDGRTFSVNNVVVRSFNILNTFGMVGVWFMSILLGGIVYFSGKKGKEGLEPGAYPKVAGWGLTLIASGASLWFGSTMLGSPWSALGAMMFFGGLIGLLIPRRTDVGGRPIDKQGSYVDPQSGYPPSPRERKTEDRNNQIEEFRKRIPKFKNVDDLNKKITRAMQNNGLNWEWVKRYKDIIIGIEKHAKNISESGKTSVDDMKEDIQEINTLINSGKNFLRYFKINSRREHRIMDAFEGDLTNQKKKLSELKIRAQSLDFYDIVSEIEAQERVIYSIENHIQKIDDLILNSLVNFKRDVIGPVNKLKRRNNDLSDLLKSSKTNKERRANQARNLSEEIRVLLREINGSLINLEAYIKYIMNDEHGVGSLLEGIRESNSNIAKSSEIAAQQTQNPKPNPEPKKEEQEKPKTGNTKQPEQNTQGNGQGNGQENNEITEEQKKAIENAIKVLKKLYPKTDNIDPRNDPFSDMRLGIKKEKVKNAEQDRERKKQRDELADAKYNKEIRQPLNVLREARRNNILTDEQNGFLKSVEDYMNACTERRTLNSLLSNLRKLNDKDFKIEDKPAVLDSARQLLKEVRDSPFRKLLEDYSEERKDGKSFSEIENQINLLSKQFSS